jgi:sortase A
VSAVTVPGQAAQDGPPGVAGAAPARPARAGPITARQVASRTLMLASGCLLLLVFNLTVVSQVREYFTDNALYGQLRVTLAEGAAPTGAYTASGALVPAGTPLAVMNAPGVGLGNAVIVQGSGGAQTMEGIGHVPDTVLPCQAGAGALMARNGSYGGIGARWARLARGDEFTVTMGQGTCTYRVEDQRLAGQLAPVPPPRGSIVLITADGRPFMPTGVLRIDAALVTKAFPPSAVLSPSSVPPSENPMGTDTSNLFELVLLMQALLAAASGAAWAWNRWGARQTWMVAVPVLLALGLLAADSVNLLLPNIM